MSERYTRRLVRLPQRMVTSFVTCMDCGSHVLDREAHDNWHAALTPTTPAVRAGDQEEKQCWLVFCWNYGHDRSRCEHRDDPKSGKKRKSASKGMRGSEAGCYS